MLFNELSPEKVNKEILIDLYTSILKVTKALNSTHSEYFKNYLLNIPLSPPNPKVFSRYYESVLNFRSGDVEKANKGINEIYSILKHPNCSECILEFSEETLSEDFGRFNKFYFHEYKNKTPARGPDKNIFKSHMEKITSGLSIVNSIDPEMYLIYKTFIKHIYVAEGSGSGFGGASSFLVWGGILVNANHYKTSVSVVEFLVHELTHCALFALNYKSKLLLNSQSETYYSHLRRSSRPIDGVFHSLIVSAMVHLFAKRWGQLGHISQSRKDEIIKMKNKNLEAFISTLPIIESEGVLSSGADRILTQCKEGILSE